MAAEKKETIVPGITVEQEKIAATGHDYKTTVTKPTCTKSGYTLYACQCGDSYTDNVVKATGHNYGDDAVCDTCGETDPETNADGEGSGCGKSDSGMYLSYVLTVLIPSAFVFLGKKFFFV